MAFKGPAIFMYQVNARTRVKPENLADWERRMRDLVGFQGQIQIQQGSVETDSWSGSPSEVDD